MRQIPSNITKKVTTGLMIHQRYIDHKYTQQQTRKLVTFKLIENKLEMYVTCKTNCIAYSFTCDIHNSIQLVSVLYQAIIQKEGEMKDEKE